MLVSKTTLDVVGHALGYYHINHLRKQTVVSNALVWLYECLRSVPAPRPPSFLAGYPYARVNDDEEDEWCLVQWHDAYAVYLGRAVNNDWAGIHIMSEILRLSTERFRARVRKAVNRGWRDRWPNSVPVTDRRRRH